MEKLPKKLKKYAKKAEEVAKEAAPASAIILILRPRGTGKELVAKEIHKRSAGKGKPFVAVDCAAITTNLFESEMFGHKKGAFTVADSDRIGKIVQAEGGILFLDKNFAVFLLLSGKCPGINKSYWQGI